MPWFPDFASAVELARRQTRSTGLADPVAEYFTALNEGDARALETVWPGEVVMSSAATRPRWPLGVRCALEYNCVRWGSHGLPPQAGIGAYECRPDGLLAAARVYDDVEAPVDHP